MEHKSICPPDESICTLKFIGAHYYSDESSKAHPLIFSPWV